MTLKRRLEILAHTSRRNFSSAKANAKPASADAAIKTATCK
jgi:hypothetical protein